MSRVGSKPVELPEGVKLIKEGQQVKVSGPRGELEITIDSNIGIESNDTKVVVTAKNKERKTRELHGLTRSLVANMVEGVFRGFEKKLEFSGVGYRAKVEEGNLILSLGYSHPIKYVPREGIIISVEKNKIIISGADRQAVGQTASEIRAFKKPEPYKGKGIRYEGEHIKRKAGKAAIKDAS